MTDKPKNIYQRLHEAMGSVAYIQKTAEVSMGKSSYKAVTHDEVTAKVRVALMDCGIIAHPVSIVRKTAPIQISKTYNGAVTESTNFYTEVDLSYRFVNIDDPKDFIDVPAIGDGIDPQDKSAGKALSMAVKNALLKALMLETGENEESRPDGDVDTKSLALMDKSGNMTIDKWHKNIIRDMSAETDLVRLDTIRYKARNDERAKKLTKEQGEMIVQQYEATKTRILEADNIPEGLR